MIHSTRQAETEHDLRVRQEADYLRQMAERTLDHARAVASMAEDVNESVGRLVALIEGDEPADPTRKVMTAEEFMGAVLSNAIDLDADDWYIEYAAEQYGPIGGVGPCNCDNGCRVVRLPSKHEGEAYGFPPDTLLTFVRSGF